MEWCLEASEFPGGRSVRGVCAIGSDLAGEARERENDACLWQPHLLFPLVVTIKQTGFSTSQLRIDWASNQITPSKSPSGRMTPCSHRGRAVRHVSSRHVACP